ncbi:hypothetical protein NMY22_g14325 [Coprinellus aureogranulatus]|nr:hypothetical protein NMY22_g14325 [Coprinellus aureogranulatus]
MSTPGREEAHPRISLDNLSDWNAVASNCKRSARKIAESQAEEDGLSAAEKELLLKHMDRFLDQTLTTVQPNLRVNGHSLDHPNTHDMENFDEALDRRIWSLADTRLQWHKRIAENRRTVPSEIRDTVSNLLSQHAEIDAISLSTDPSQFDETFSADDGEAEQFETEELLDTVRKNTAFAEELAQVRALYFCLGYNDTDATRKKRKGQGGVWRDQGSAAMIAPLTCIHDLLKPPLPPPRPPPNPPPRPPPNPPPTEPRLPTPHDYLSLSMTISLLHIFPYLHTYRLSALG